MVKQGSDKSRDGEQSTVKLPPRPSELEKLQTRLEAKGYDPTQFKIRSVRKKADGKGLDIDMSFSLPQDVAEQLIKDLTIKAFDPDPQASGKSVTELVSVKEVHEPEPAVKLWRGKERGKRSKPKSDSPDLA